MPLPLGSLLCWPGLRKVPSPLSHKTGSHGASLRAVVGIQWRWAWNSVNEGHVGGTAVAVSSARAPQAGGPHSTGASGRPGGLMTQASEGVGWAEAQAPLCAPSRRGPPAHTVGDSAGRTWPGCGLPSGPLAGELCSGSHYPAARGSPRQRPRPADRHLQSSLLCHGGHVCPAPSLSLCPVPTLDLGSLGPQEGLRPPLWPPGG